VEAYQLTLDVSSANEGTDAPWWAILDPDQMMRADVHQLAGMITGPFFSRAEAEYELTCRHYSYGKHACVYCMSGYRTDVYRQAYHQAEKKKDPNA
jgi:hypothetical protein